MGWVSGTIEPRETLAANGAYYREAQGKVIEEWPLLVQIRRAFEHLDRASDVRRRQVNGTSVGTPAWSRHGTGTESDNG
jgi:hypothetical protein